MSCAVEICKNIKRFKPEGVTFHQFPHGRLLEEWLDALGKGNDWVWSKNKFICSEHFTADDFLEGAQRERCRLKINAVPTLRLSKEFLPPLSLIPSTSQQDERNIIKEENLQRSSFLTFRDSSTAVVTIQDFNRICRICLEGENLCHIHFTYISDIKVADLLEYNEISDPKNEQLPQNICQKCIKDLFQFYEFKKRCHDIETLLNNLLEVSKNDNIEKDSKSNVTLIDKTSNNTNIEEENEREIYFVVENVDLKVEVNDCVKSEQKSIEIEKIWKCIHCNYVATDERKLRNHRTTHYTRQCGICKKTISQKAYRQHMRVHTKEKPYKCDVCFRRFSISENLKRHRKRHTGERPYVCSFCGKGFIQVKSLHTHEERYHSNGNMVYNVDATKYKCEYCWREFTHPHHFNAHIKKHASKDQTDQSEKPDVPRDYVCEICGGTFKRKTALSQHKITHGEKSFLCSDCGKSFWTKMQLQTHSTIHTGETPYTCHICNKSFRQATSLTLHMRTHSGFKPYKCSFCARCFPQRPQLKTHLKTHTGEKPYTCTFCNKSFALNGNLTVHMRLHTGETPYKCPVCDKGYRDSSSMKRHWRKHKDAASGEEPNKDEISL